MFLYVFYFLSLSEDLPEWSWGLTLQRTTLLVMAAIPLFFLFGGLYDYLLKHRLRAKPLRRRPRKPV